MVKKTKSTQENLNLNDKKIKGQVIGSLIDEHRIRENRAVFVETFKYKFTPDSIVVSRLIQNAKRIANTFWDKIKKAISLVKWKISLLDSVVWLLEAAIEGLVINFAINQLLGYKLTLGTILAYGIVVKEIIYFVSRVKKDGATEKLSGKHNDF